MHLAYLDIFINTCKYTKDFESFPSQWEKKSHLVLEILQAATGVRKERLCLPCPESTDRCIEVHPGHQVVVVQTGGKQSDAASTTRAPHKAVRPPAPSARQLDDGTRAKGAALRNMVGKGGDGMILVLHSMLSFYTFLHKPE